MSASWRTSVLLYTPLILLAVAVQIQILWGETESYTGLRLNLGDFVLFALGLYVLTSLFLKKSVWPKWQQPVTDYWFYGLLAVIGIGLLNAYFLYGEVSHWALFNRGLGWGVITAYVFFSGWLVTNYDEKLLFVLLRTFILFVFIVMILSTIWFLLFRFEAHESNFDQAYIQLEGLMGNRNAFAFLMLCAVILYSYMDLKKIDLLPRFQNFLTYTIWFFLPLAMIFSGSRAGLLGTGIIVIWFIATKFKYSLRKIIPPVLLTSLCVAAMYAYHPRVVFREAQNVKMRDIASSQITAGTDKRRILGAQDAMALWSEHKILGGGIGGFINYQVDKYDALQDHIDNSALWIITELGLIGVFVFGGFYIVALMALWRTYKRADGLQSVLAQSMMVIMGVFALYSMVHQIMYARYLWLLLGLSLAMPMINQNERKE